MLYFNETQIIRNKFTAYFGYSLREHYQNKTWVQNDVLELIHTNITIMIISRKPTYFIIIGQIGVEGFN